jgi:hypothetical protein
MLRQIPKAIREYILEKYNNHCVYCGAFASTVDHIIPYAYTQEHNPDNLVACCNDCNSIALDKVFDNFEQKAAYSPAAALAAVWVGCINIIAKLRRETHRKRGDCSTIATRNLNFLQRK